MSRKALRFPFIERISVGETFRTSGCCSFDSYRCTVSHYPTLAGPKAKAPRRASARAMSGEAFSSTFRRRLRSALKASASPFLHALLSMEGAASTSPSLLEAEPRTSFTTLMMASCWPGILSSTVARALLFCRRAAAAGPATATAGCRHSDLFSRTSQSREGRDAHLLDGVDDGLELGRGLYDLGLVTLVSSDMMIVDYCSSGYRSERDDEA